MGTFHLSLTLEKAKKDKQLISYEEPRGLFLWIGGANVVDWVVGYHKKRGFIVDKAYHTGNHWLKDLLISSTHKDGFVRLTRFL